MSYMLDSLLHTYEHKEVKIGNPPSHYCHSFIKPTIVILLTEFSIVMAHHFQYRDTTTSCNVGNGRKYH